MKSNQVFRIKEKTYVRYVIEVFMSTVAGMREREIKNKREREKEQEMEPGALLK